MLNVIIPVHNGERYLLQAVQSVFEQRVPLELRIVDDGSTDGTVALLEQMQPPDWVKLSWSSQPKAGPSAARNRAIRAGSGGFIVFLDSDDVLLPGVLSNLLEQSELHPHDVIWAKTQWTDLDLVPFQHPQYRNWQIQMGAAVWPRSVFNKVGLLDEALQFNEDTDLFMRCLEADVTLRKFDVLAQLYRRHPNNLTKDLAHSQKAMVSAVHRSLQRQREKRHE